MDETFIPFYKLQTMIHVLYRYYATSRALEYYYYCYYCCSWARKDSQSALQHEGRIFQIHATGNCIVNKGA